MSMEASTSMYGQNSDEVEVYQNEEHPNEDLSNQYPKVVLSEQVTLKGFKITNGYGCAELVIKREISDFEDLGRIIETKSKSKLITKVQYEFRVIYLSRRQTDQVSRIVKNDPSRLSYNLTGMFDESFGKNSARLDLPRGYVHFSDIAEKSDCAIYFILRFLLIHNTHLTSYWKLAAAMKDTSMKDVYDLLIPFLSKIKIEKMFLEALRIVLMCIQKSMQETCLKNAGNGDKEKCRDFEQDMEMFRKRYSYFPKFLQHILTKNCMSSVTVINGIGYIFRIIYNYNGPQINFQENDNNHHSHCDTMPTQNPIKDRGTKRSVDQAISPESKSKRKLMESDVSNDHSDKQMPEDSQNKKIPYPDILPNDPNGSKSADEELKESLPQHIYEIGYNQIQKKEFIIDMLIIAMRYNFTKNLQKIMLNNLLTHFSSVELMWRDIAMRALDGSPYVEHHFLSEPLSEESFSDTQDCEVLHICEEHMAPSHVTRIRLIRCCRMFKMALDIQDTLEMFSLYLTFLLDSIKDGTFRMLKKKLLVDCFEVGHNKGYLQEKHYLQWMIIKTNDTMMIPDVLRKATERFSNSDVLWQMRMDYYISRKEEENSMAVLNQAVQILGHDDKSTVLLRKMLINYWLQNDVEKALEVCQEGINEEFSSAITFKQSRNNIVAFLKRGVENKWFRWHD